MPTGARQSRAPRGPSLATTQLVLGVRPEAHRAASADPAFGYSGTGARAVVEIACGDATGGPQKPGPIILDSLPWRLRVVDSTPCLTDGPSPTANGPVFPGGTKIANLLKSAPMMSRGPEGDNDSLISRLW
ncbi:hypothetical protein ACRE_069950 [Hapsidospora chrysogenum ATCC 11550]|uniref:Uncharacterized protein n=1 Tax=Hapsidospora chrysogenum (strain ATCC 11550 / CBS 779.69 / DSM 880 / IAM 14645 / JCM 23072 / IMI 49137) TaxID=857340 RepID=A0A086SYS7_HAPC1|nr:hypothetical protein ACRE_069950 [Hapsidospora chrysogenum ATCC 11550]